MPEIMQLGPDDNDINPYLTPCPVDYPPCPLCGEHPDMLESGHIICCNILVNNPDAWFLLPRALTWTNEPPRVVGKFWIRDKRRPDESGIINVTETKLDGYRRNPIGEYEQFAGPIPEPVEE